ncbi:MAG: tRNA lysidine(34) synthetase TilS [Clostridia bacterium]|nr:tRNA lysidine(34) synthetase TilS [Clostridia bacterium]
MIDASTFWRATERVRKALRSLIPSRGAGILVALSGGADSIFLLSCLSRIAESEGIRLSALHVEHGIRGEESLSDAELCRALCAELSVPLTVVSLSVPTEAEKTGEGLEECARRLRYEALEKERERLSLDYIAVAHHADDQAETVLLHLLRGSGARGLCGMAPLRGRILRPLLGFSADEIRTLVSKAEIPFAVDSTNADETYTRNFVRARVLPTLERVTPEPASAICRAAELLRRDLACLDRMAEEVLDDPERACSRRVLAELPDPIRARVVIGLAARAGCEMPSLSQIDLATQKIGEIGTFRVSFPSSLTLCIGRDRVCFEKGSETRLPDEPLQMGENQLSGNRGTIFLFRDQKDISDSINVYKKSIKAVVSSDKILGSLSVRQLLPGDAYRYAGMRRAVKKLFASRRLSDEQRRSAPIVCDGAGILWIPGFGVREGSEPTEDAEHLTLLYVPRNDGKVKEGR